MSEIETAFRYALTLVLREIQDHEDNSLDKRMKLDRPGQVFNEEWNSLRTEASGESIGIDLCKRCVLDVAKMLRIDISHMDEE